MSKAKDNITPIIKIQSQSTVNPVTLVSVIEEMKAWRLTKKKRNDRIPASLWDKIFVLLNTEQETKILTVLGITRSQLAVEKQRHQATGTISETKISPPIGSVDFCEATREPVTPLAYKPAKAFNTTTSVVELYRPDGMLMKIHICTDRFEELLRAFIKV